MVKMGTVEDHTQAKGAHKLTLSNRLTLEKGEIDLEGRIDSIQYSEVSDFKKGGETLLNRLFR